MDDVLARVSLTLICTPAEFDFPGPPSTATTHDVGPIFDPGTGGEPWAHHGILTTNGPSCSLASAQRFRARIGPSAHHGSAAGLPVGCC